jgi:hypothetical protein
LAVGNLGREKTQLTLVANDYSLDLFVVYYDEQYQVRETAWLGCGIVQQLNTNQNYFTADYRSKFVCGLANSTTSKLFHFIGGNQKQLITSYEYPIVCSDGQVPFSRWLSTCLLFEDNSALDNPCLGQFHNHLIGSGPFTIGKLVEIQGSAFPYSSSSQTYLPVCKFSQNRTLLIKTLAQ